MGICFCCCSELKQVNCLNPVQVVYFMIWIRSDWRARSHESRLVVCDAFEQLLHICNGSSFVYYKEGCDALSVMHQVGGRGCCKILALLSRSLETGIGGSNCNTYTSWLFLLGAFECGVTELPITSFDLMAVEGHIPPSNLLWYLFRCSQSVARCHVTWYLPSLIEIVLWRLCPCRSPGWLIRIRSRSNFVTFYWLILPLYRNSDVI